MRAYIDGLLYKYSLGRVGTPLWRCYCAGTKCLGETMPPIEY